MKKLLFAIAAMAMFSFTACTGGAEGEAAKTDSVAAETPEAVKAETPAPTGDAEADAKAVIDYMKAKIENAQTAEDFLGLEKDITPMMEAFEKAYAEGDAKKKFDEAGEKYLKEIGFNFEQAMEDWMKNHPDEYKKVLTKAFEEKAAEEAAK